MAVAPLRLPAEWEPQRATIISWPRDRTIWEPELPYASVIRAFTQLAAAIAEFQPVVVCLPPDDHTTRSILERVITSGRLRLAAIWSDDCWVRDYGPITVFTQPGPRYLDFRFDGWGGKFPAARDDQVAAALHRTGALGDGPLERVELVLEGGSIESNGADTILTTQACLETATRNPHLTADALQQRLLEHFGAQRMIWLEHGAIVGDDTDGHVDMLARFAPDDTICYAACDDPGDEHYRPLQALARELADLRTPQNRPYRCIPLPIPAPIHAADGRRLPASYANFVIVNGGVLAPAYGDAGDRGAAERLQRAFPDRRIRLVDAGTLIHQGGALHCATMHLPA